MATKLLPAQVKQLTAVGITCKTGTEEEAKKKLIEFLAKNEVVEVENETLKDLIEMAEVFYEAPEETEEEEQVEEENEPLEEELLDELAEEVKETPAPVKSKPAPAKSAPAKPVAAAKASKPAAAVKAVKSADGEKFDARNNPKHAKMLETFINIFPKKSFQIDTLKQGFTVRVLGGNAKTTILNFDELKIVGGKLIGNLYTNRFKSPEDLMPFLPESIQDKEIGMYRAESHPSIRKVTEAELFEILQGDEGFLAETLKRAGDKDVKMGINREKLEATLAAESKKPVKKAAKKEPEEEELVEEELELELEEEPELEPEIEEEPAPVKKPAAKKSAPAKKSANKKK